MVVGEVSTPRRGIVPHSGHFTNLDKVMNTEDKFIYQGIQSGAQANEAIANAITLKAQEMLQDSLKRNFEVMLQAKLTQMLGETLSLHAADTKQFAEKYLGQSKTAIAKGMIDTQHTYNISSLPELDLTSLTGFNTNMDDEVKKLADESGTITIEADSTSSVGF